MTCECMCISAAGMCWRFFRLPDMDAESRILFQRRSALSEQRNTCKIAQRQYKSILINSLLSWLTNFLCCHHKQIKAMVPTCFVFSDSAACFGHLEVARTWVVNSNNSLQLIWHDCVMRWEILVTQQKPMLSRAIFYYYVIALRMQYKGAYIKYRLLARS